MQPLIASICTLASVVGAQAWQRIPGGAAPTSTNFAIAYDAARMRSVLVTFSMQDPTTSRTETWEWDGSAWLLRPTNTPALNGAFDVTYDAARRVILLVKSDPNPGTWAYDGIDWNFVATPPALTTDPRLTYDSARAVPVMYANGLFYELVNGSWIEPAGQTPLQLGSLTVRFTDIAFDAIQARVVLFGGQAGSQADARTFLWDGTTRTQANPATVPSARFAHRLISDPVTGRVQLLGGSTFNSLSLGDAFAWNGSDWVPTTPLSIARRWHDATMHGDTRLVYGGMGFTTVVTRSLEWLPPTGQVQIIESQRPNVALAYDDVRQRTVGVSTQRTLEFDGYRWTDLGIAPPTNLVSLGFHGGTARLIGVDLNGTTWTFDGTTWSQVANNGSTPPGARRAAMSYDPLRDRLVMFGGRLADNTLIDQTWEWDGFGWTRRFPATTPPTSAEPSMCWHPVVGSTLLVTGGGQPGLSWNGVDWSVASAPVPAGASPRIGYDPQRGVVLVMAPGAFFSGPAATFVLAGGTWVAGPTGVGFRTSPGLLSYDLVRGALVAHDLVHANDLILTSLPAAAVPYGSGCAGASGAPRITAVTRPAIGARFVVDVLDAAPDSIALLWVSDSQTSAALPGGCFALVLDPWIAAVAATTATGFASFTFGVSGSPSLLGLDLFEQAMSFEPGGPLLGFASLSDGLRLTVGD